MRFGAQAGGGTIEHVSVNVISKPDIVVLNSIYVLKKNGNPLAAGFR